jgi:hypothetical protein
MAICAFVLVEYWAAVGSRSMASLYLLSHIEEMEQAQRAAGTGQPAAIEYVEGIPDGGQAIVRSDVLPSELSQRVQLKLTGERIKRCRRIIRGSWLCSFD